MEVDICLVCDLIQNVKNIQEIRKSLAILHEHNKNLQKSTKCQCDFCGKWFDEIDMLDSHVLEFHEADAVEKNMSYVANLNKKSHLSCGICKKTFENEQDLQSHKNDFHKTEKLFHCNDCKKCFKFEKSLDIHMNRHLKNESKSPPLRKSLYECELCKKCFDKEPEIEFHIKDFHRIDSYLLNEESYFSCEKCEKTFALQKDLNHHLNENCLSLYDCSRCQSYFANQEDLNKHVLSHKNEINVVELKKEKVEMINSKKYYIKKEVLKFPCNLCDKYFDIASDLTKHKDTVHFVPKQEPIDVTNMKHVQLANLEHRCKQCPMTFPNVNSFQIHKKNHSRFFHQCQDCHLHFRHLTDLKVHAKSHDYVGKMKASDEGSDEIVNIALEKPFSYQCGIENCKTEFTSKDFLLRKLLRHLKIEHRNLPMKDISEKLSEVYALKSESKPITSNQDDIDIHDDKKIDVEKVTAKNYSADALDDHEKRNTNLLPTLMKQENNEELLTDYRCDICEKHFNRQVTLQDHIKKIHKVAKSPIIEISKKTHSINPRKHKCNFCEKAFFTKKLRFRHQLRFHKSAKIATLFTCDVCEKVFSNAKDLKSHFTNHKQKIIYECDICEERFKTVPDLKAHFETHNKTSNNTTNLQNHSNTTRFIPIKDGNFQCDACKTVLNSMMSFRKHLARFVHRFHCDECNKGFGFKSDCDRHRLRCSK